MFLCVCCSIILHLPWAILVLFSVGLPTSLGMDRWQGSQRSFSSHITTFRPFERDRISCSNACLSLTALWVTLPTREQHQEGKVSNAIEFNFPPFFPHHFLSLLHRLKSFEFSGVNIEFEWFFKGTKCKWMDQRCFLSLCIQDTGLEKQRYLHFQSCWLSSSWRKINASFIICYWLFSDT